MAVRASPAGVPAPKASGSARLRLPDAATRACRQAPRPGHTRGHDDITITTTDSTWQSEYAKSRLGAECAFAVNADEHDLLLEAFERNVGKLGGNLLIGLGLKTILGQV